MRVRGIVLGLAAAALLSLPARAQWGLYGQATGANLRTPGTEHLYGGSFGFYKTKQAGLVSIGPDFRGAMLKRGGSQGSFTDQALDMGQLGVRVAAAPKAFPLKPYAEALFGLGYWRGGVGLARQDATHWMMQGLAGLDYRVKSQVDWRVVEISYGRLGAEPGFINPVTVSTGIVLRLP